MMSQMTLRDSGSRPVVTSSMRHTDEPPTNMQASCSLRFCPPLRLPARLDAYDGDVSTVDLSGIDRFDTIGAWVVHRFADKRDAQIEGLGENSAHLLDQVEKADQPVRMRPETVASWQRVVGEVGDATVHAGRSAVGLIGFLGATLIAFWAVVTHPKRFRFNAVVQRFEVE